MKKSLFALSTLAVILSQVASVSAQVMPTSSPIPAAPPPNPPVVAAPAPKIGSIAYIHSVDDVIHNLFANTNPPSEIFSIRLTDYGQTSKRLLNGSLSTPRFGAFNRECIKFLRDADTAKKVAPEKFGKRFIAIGYVGRPGGTGMGGVQQWSDVDFTSCSVSDPK